MNLGKTSTSYHRSDFCEKDCSFRIGARSNVRQKPFSAPARHNNATEELNSYQVIKPF